MSSYAQATRQLTIDTPLGSDVLLLSAVHGQESISRLFAFDLSLLSSNDAIAPADIVGKAVTVSLSTGESSFRYFNGMISQFSAGPAGPAGLRTYRATMVPWLWFLTLTADCRIFQDKTAPDIIEQIFKDLSFTDYQVSVSGNHPSRPYCVQYRESDFNFVSRLMEEEGMFYFFRHEQGKHTLVISDQASAYQDCVENDVDYSTGSHSPNTIQQWQHQYRYRPGKWTYSDYNFETPATKLLTSTNTLVSLPGIQSYEIYDYPGDYTAVQPDGAALVKTRMQEEETPYDTVLGDSNCPTFTPGGKFKLGKHDFDGELSTYVLTSITHEALGEGAYASGQAGEAGYRNSFTCMPATVVFTPPRLARKPFVQGPQTAVVVGPSGEEIYTDKYGRIKVQFFWDRLGKNNETSSCWIRVAHGWSGQTWGIVFHPRVGQEVIVDFLEGDPDRPIITGRVNNATEMPPYTLPTNQTQSTIKTRSTPNGDATTFNELRFEDKKDSEEVYFHAEKDFNRVVENNDTLKVGFDKKKDGDQTIDIYNNRTVTLDQGNELFEVKTGNRDVKIDKGNDTHTISQGNRTVEISQGNDALTVTQGNRTTTITAGKATTEAGTSIELKVGENSILINQSGITIKGLNITLQGQTKIAASAPVIQVSADGTLTLKGGMVQIN